MPLFSCSKVNEIWILALEKAYAKMSKNYEYLERLSPKVILKDLTGMPCFEINLEDISLIELNEKLITSDHNGKKLILNEIKILF